MGRKYGKGAWTATGVIGIIVFILYIAALAVMAGALASFIGAVQSGNITGGYNMSGGLGGLRAGAAAATWTSGIAMILGFVWAIMEIIVLWSAGNYFRSGFLKGASILMIIVFILTLAVVPTLVAGLVGAAVGGAAGTA